MKYSRADPEGDRAEHAVVHHVESEGIVGDRALNVVVQPERIRQSRAIRYESIKSVII